MPRPQRLPKFSTIRSPPVVRETRRWTYLFFKSGRKVPWIVEDWPDDDTTVLSAESTNFTLSPRLDLMLIYRRFWIYPKTYVVADSIQLHKLLLDSQLATSKTYNCSALVVTQASDKDVKAFRSILEHPTCRMRGLRNLTHIAFGKVMKHPLVLKSAMLTLPSLYVDLNSTLFCGEVEIFVPVLLRIMQQTLALKHKGST